MKSFLVTIGVSGNIDLAIEAGSEESARKIAEKVIEKACIASDAFNEKKISDVGECIFYEVDNVEEVE